MSSRLGSIKRRFLGNAARRSRLAKGLARYQEPTGFGRVLALLQGSLGGQAATLTVLIFLVLVTLTGHC